MHRGLAIDRDRWVDDSAACTSPCFQTEDGTISCRSPDSEPVSGIVKRFKVFPLAERVEFLSMMRRSQRGTAQGNRAVPCRSGRLRADDRCPRPLVQILSPQEYRVPR